MMQYRRNRNTKRATALKVLLYAGIAISVVFADSFFGAPLKTTLRTIVTPVFSTIHEVTSAQFFAYVTSKQSLMQKNEQLEQRIALLEQQQRSEGIMREDAKYFCAAEHVITETTPGEGSDVPAVITKRAVKKPAAFLGTESMTRAYATGRVIAYERVLLGTLIVQFENEQPVAGDFVLDDAGQPLGIVDVVHESTASVQLLTMVNKTHEVRIGKAHAQAQGRLSNTFIVFLPQEEVVAVGDVVVLTALHIPLGTVVHVERSPADAQVLLYVRPYAQPLQTRFVSFVRNPLLQIHE